MSKFDLIKEVMQTFLCCHNLVAIRVRMTKHMQLQ